MKNLLILGVVTFFGLNGFAFSVDTTKSQVTWKGAKVVGDTHVGNVKIKEADLKWKGDVPQKGKVVIDMTTITNTDIKSDKYNKKLVGHLKSDDFFSVDKFKTATLDIKNVAKVKGKYILTGDLEIKGKKQPVTVTATVTKKSKGMKKVKAEFTFDRTEYGIRYGSGKFFEDLGDKMIKDIVEIAVDLHLTQGDA